MKAGVVYHQLVGEGGLERYLLGFVRNLVAAGHDVHVVTAYADDAGLGCGAKVHVLPGGRVRTGPDFRAFDEASHTAARNLDLDAVLGFGRTTRQDIHRAGGGCHKVYSRLLSPRRRLREKNRAELELEERLYRGGQTRHFVVNSRMVGGQLTAEYDVPPERIEIIHTPVDSGRFAPDRGGAVRSRIRENLGTPENRNVLLFVSREHRRKGLGALLDAVRGLDAELWVAGPAPSWRVTWKAGDNVKTIGVRSDLSDVFRAADLFVHPTLYDACANAVLQAMASGIPSLVSERDGAAEFIDHGQTGFRLPEPDNPVALRETIESTLALPKAERHAIGAAARDRVVPLTWDAHIEKWMALMEKLGGSAPPTAEAPQ